MFSIPYYILSFLPFHSCLFWGFFRHAFRNASLLRKSMVSNSSVVLTPTPSTSLLTQRSTYALTKNVTSLTRTDAPTFISALCTLRQRTSCSSPILVSLVGLPEVFDDAVEEGGEGGGVARRQRREALRGQGLEGSGQRGWYAVDEVAARAQLLRQLRLVVFHERLVDGDHVLLPGRLHLEAGARAGVGDHQGGRGDVRRQGRLVPEVGQRKHGSC